MPVPVVSFSDERLPNGLRLIVAEDHLAPVVAVNVWYNVGSKHEVTGKTGFAHLFEHVMFQGSAHVGKAEHMALVQAAGGTVNGTTWLDRTNYFETMPSHQLELALWLEADRMGTLLDALSQENLDNQREVVKNEKRWSYDNRPYGTWVHKLLGHLYPESHPYHHPTIGSMDDLDAASLEDVRHFFETYYAPNNAVLSVVGDCDHEQVRTWADRYFGAIPANPAIPALPDLSLPRLIGEEKREVVVDVVPLPRVCFAFRGPAFGDPRLDALDMATQLLSGGKSSRLVRRLVRDERIAQDLMIATLPAVGGASAVLGYATVRPGVDPGLVEAAFIDELARLAAEAPSEDEMVRARALTEADELGSLAHVEERADRLSMYATLFDDPGLINTMLARYLSVTAEQVRDVAVAVFRADNRVVLTYLPATGSAGAAEEPAESVAPVPVDGAAEAVDAGEAEA
jgi:predicted Zn-dependent peptidase